MPPRPPFVEPAPRRSRSRTTTSVSPRSARKNAVATPTMPPPTMRVEARSGTLSSTSRRELREAVLPVLARHRAEPREVVGEADDPRLVRGALQDRALRLEGVEGEEVERGDPGQRQVVPVGHEVRREEERALPVREPHRLGAA